MARTANERPVRTGGATSTRRTNSPQPAKMKHCGNQYIHSYTDRYDKAAWQQHVNAIALQDNNIAHQSYEYSAATSSRRDKSVPGMCMRSVDYENIPFVNRMRRKSAHWPRYGPTLPTEAAGHRVSQAVHLETQPILTAILCMLRYPSARSAAMDACKGLWRLDKLVAFQRT